MNLKPGDKVRLTVPYLIGINDFKAFRGDVFTVACTSYGGNTINVCRENFSYDYSTNGQTIIFGIIGISRQHLELVTS